MKKQLLFSLLLVAAPLLLMATTHTGDVFLYTQAQVDSFKITTGNADTITGFVIVSGAGIMNLDSLHNLQSIGGFLEIINNNSLVNLDGLQNLQSIGGPLYIIFNNSLVNLDGLQNLQSIGGDLRITSNSMLNACCGVFPVISKEGGVSVDIRQNAPGCNNRGEIVNGGACARILPSVPIPTMGQWGLFLFGLVVLTLGVVGIWNLSIIRGMTQDK